MGNNGDSKTSQRSWTQSRVVKALGVEKKAKIMMQTGNPLEAMLFFDEVVRCLEQAEWEVLECGMRVEAKPEEQDQLSA